jgi:hypothetical protein
LVKEKMNILCGFMPAACSPTLSTRHISPVNTSNKPITQRWNDSQNITDAWWVYGKAHREEAARQIDKGESMFIFIRCKHTCQII